MHLHAFVVSLFSINNQWPSSGCQAEVYECLVHIFYACCWH